jgi:hypothetical protein
LLFNESVSHGLEAILVMIVLGGEFGMVGELYSSMEGFLESFGFSLAILSGSISNPIQVKFSGFCTSVGLAWIIKPLYPELFVASFAIVFMLLLQKQIVIFVKGRKHFLCNLYSSSTSMHFSNYFYRFGRIHNLYCSYYEE